MSRAGLTLCALENIICVMRPYVWRYDKEQAMSPTKAIAFITLMCILLCAAGVCLSETLAPGETPAPTPNVDFVLDPESDEIRFIATTTSMLKMRAEPDTSSGNVQQIQKGQTVYILSMNEEWALIRTSRRDGYILSKYLKDIRYYEALRERVGAYVPIPTPTLNPDGSTPKPGNPTATPKPTKVPTPTEAPQGKPVLPELNEKGFLAEEGAEFVHADAEDGLWIYISNTLYVDIRRYYEPDKALKWEVADIRADVSAGETMHTVYNDTTTRAYKNYISPDVLAMRKKIVFSMSTDYYTYRTESKRSNPNSKVGVIMRNFEVLYDDPAGPKRSNHTPLTILALFPDGDMKTYYATEISGAELKEQGARDVFSFGPILVQNFEVTQQALTSERNTREPRIGLGIVDKGHYIAIMVEGRLGDKNKGLSMTDFGVLFQTYGVREAMALDGGQTSYMNFMGEYVNATGSYGAGKKSRPRESTELLGIGYSELVPDYTGTDYK